MSPSHNRANHSSVALSSIEAGEQVQLIRVDGGHGLVSRLTAMGLVPGVKLRVMNSSDSGPFVIAIQNSRIVLGRGVTHKICVAPL